MGGRWSVVCQTGGRRHCGACQTQTGRVQRASNRSSRRDLTVAINTAIHPSPTARGPHLVCAPASLLDNWAREIGHWCPKLRIVTYHGNSRCGWRLAVGGWRFLAVGGRLAAVGDLGVNCSWSLPIRHRIPPILQTSPTQTHHLYVIPTGTRRAGGWNRGASRWPRPWTPGS